MSESCENIASDGWLRRVEEAYRLHGERIATILRAHYPAAMVDDSIQEVFLRMLTNGAPLQVPVEVALSPAYLLVCTRRDLWHALRGAKSNAKRLRAGLENGRLELNARPTRRQDPLHRAEPATDQDTLDSAMESLPANDRALMMVIMGQDNSNVAVARWLDCDSSCVGVRRHRAVQKLREILVCQSGPAKGRGVRDDNPRRLGSDGRTSERSDSRH